MLGKGLQLKTTAKNYLLLWLVKYLKKLVNNRIVDHLENVVFFLISSMVLDLFNQLLIFSVVYDRIARAFNRSGATQAVALDISKAFGRVWHAGLLHKRKSYGDDTTLHSK